MKRVSGGSRKMGGPGRSGSSMGSKSSHTFRSGGSSLRNIQHRNNDPYNTKKNPNNEHGRAYWNSLTPSYIGIIAFVIFGIIAGLLILYFLS